MMRDPRVQQQPVENAAAIQNVPAEVLVWAVRYGFSVKTSDDVRLVEQAYEQDQRRRARELA